PPTRIPVNQGAVQLALSAPLTEGEPRLILPAIQMVDRVDLTRAITVNFAQYINPILAQGTGEGDAEGGRLEGRFSVDGQFSLELDGGEIPLGKPRLGTAQGRMTVHNVDVGGGPIVRELARLFRVPPT